MAKTRPYTLLPGWRLLLRDAGIDPASVLRQAGLPADLFSAHDRALLQFEEYFRLFHGNLQNTELPAAEISYLLGYEDSNCFYRAFRGWTGVTPSQAREHGGATRRTMGSCSRNNLDPRYGKSGVAVSPRRAK